jgi:hypothetical protein
VILYDLSESEHHPAYQDLAISNGDRQFSFLQSLVNAALTTDQGFLSHSVLKALNFHAIACLHPSAGQYRPCQVKVGPHMPPEHFRVDAMMEHFVNLVNRNWDRADPLTLAAFVLWRLNFIHPFINGNGRTARAAAYFVVCVRAGGWLPGSPILPSSLKSRDADYVAAIRYADETARQGNVDVDPLRQLVEELLTAQLRSAGIAPAP